MIRKKREALQMIIDRSVDEFQFVFVVIHELIDEEYPMDSIDQIQL